jgi:hypothetical protein
MNANARNVPVLAPFYFSKKFELALSTVLSRYADLLSLKGPGDRVQNNKRRFLEYYRSHQIPVAVGYARWRAEAHRRIPTAGPESAS